MIGSPNLSDRAVCGNLQDPGGLSAGELPDAPPIWVESERDLKHEVERLVVALDEKQDWTKRIEVTQLAMPWLGVKSVGSILTVGKALVAAAILGAC